jgi:hypothetical protein
MCGALDQAAQRRTGKDDTSGPEPGKVASAHSTPATAAIFGKARNSEADSAWSYTTARISAVQVVAAADLAILDPEHVGRRIGRDCANGGPVGRVSSISRALLQKLGSASP